MNKGQMSVNHATLSPSCFGAGWQPGRNWAAGVTLSSLENAVAKDQVFNKLALVSLFGSPMLSFATMPLVSQAKAKPLLPPTLPAPTLPAPPHCLPILTNLVLLICTFIPIPTAFETMAIHPLHSRLTSMSLPLASEFAWDLQGHVSY